MAQPRIPTGFDFTDPEIYVHGIPHAEFAEMRRNAPVWWIPQERGSAGFDDEGYWAVTRHADVMAVSRDSETFSSWENTAIVRFQAGMPRDRIEMQRYVLLNMDPPEHTQQRSIVSRGFTPRAINSLRGTLTERAQRIVGDNSEAGDFVTQIACELPLQAIAELLGVPQEDRRNVFDWSNSMIGYDDPEYSEAADPLEPAMELLGYAMKMAEDRQACPRDDIVSTLVQAEIGGEHLSSDEFGFFVLMLAVAGNETTRNAISHGMLAFLEHPEQWAAFKATRPRTAVDEIVRWGTPVNVFQRTATRDVELGGQQIHKGDRVAIFYGSANFDEEVFDHPEKFDITRSPNPHLGFGGSGAHFCLGANLARLEIDLIFNAIADLAPEISLAGPAERLRSGWLNSIKHLPVRYH
ncbi:cholest-4-en-3-one 26-monooxygenase [Actinoplanes tereljensis]|uniref:Cytochrome P450 n=1 Tax=Paractinoplanes tereljensis TaxID=571912 RepID=A0A919NRR3_9ACTN|nr:cytochrome P450 [Actinoplanes tereljensis]GIF22799.1 cytochrome P450 [Actinoplanes tereljensis]